MSKKIDIEALTENVRKGAFLRECEIPMGYTCGYPLLSIKNDILCLIIPFLKYKMTGVPDKTLVYPIRYTVTVTLPDGKTAGFEDLQLNPLFAGIDFEKPIGYFRHEEIKEFTKNEYFSKKSELFSMYGKMASAIIGEGEFSEEEDYQFFALLNIMLEPSLRPIYKAIDSDFYNKYLSGEE